MAQTLIPISQQDLHAVLSQLFDLHVQAVEAHAHFRGTRFIGMQNRLEAVVQTARQGSGAVAELVRESGRDGARRLSTMEIPTTVPGLMPGERCAAAAVNMITDRISFVLRTIHHAHEQIGGTDQSIADLLGEIGQMVEKQGLLLRAESRRMNTGPQ